MTQPTGVRVLVADDDETMRKVISWALEDVGFAWQRVENGAQALEVLRTAPTPLVVVLDLMMPVLSGWGVLDAVEADPACLGRHAYIVLTAAYRPLLLAQHQQLFRLHAAFIHKPFDIDHLVRVARQAADRLSRGYASGWGGCGLTGARRCRER